MKMHLSKHAAPPEAADKHLTEHGSSCLFGAASVVVMGVGVLARNPIVAGGGALMAGFLIFTRLLSDLRSGVSSSNWGTWRRDENYVGFRRNISFWSVIALFWFVLGTLTVLGWVRLPAT